MAVGFVNPFAPSPLANLDAHLATEEHPFEGIKEDDPDLFYPEYRKGHYGYHKTYSAKLVYKRPRHFFNEKDYLRIAKTIYGYSINKTDGSPERIKQAWWLELMRKMTIAMMDEIFDVIDLVPGVRTEDIIGKPEEVYDKIHSLGVEMLDKLIGYYKQKGLNDLGEALQGLSITMYQ